VRNVVKDIEPAKCRGKFKPEYLNDYNGWLAEFKFHGCRYLMYDGRKFLSRHISVKGGYVDKSDSLKHLWLPDMEGTVLDGEIIHTLYGTVRDVTSILGSATALAIEKQRERGYLQYAVFDIPFYKGKDIRSLPLFKRKRILEGINFDSSYIHRVSTIEVNKERYYKNIIKRGGEGIVLKQRESQYGDRSKWVKLKKVDTWDVIIVGYLDPSAESEKVDGTISVTRYKKMGWIGSIKIAQPKPYPSTYMLDCGSVSGMDESIRAMISKHPSKYLGKVIEIKAQSRLESGKFEHPRFVRFRDDKRPEDCEYEG
jgi:ATP-dependent DNA ligase